MQNGGRAKISITSSHGGLLRRRRNTQEVTFDLFSVRFIHDANYYYNAAARHENGHALFSLNFHSPRLILILAVAKFNF